MPPRNRVTIKVCKSFIFEKKKSFLWKIFILSRKPVNLYEEQKGDVSKNKRLAWPPLPVKLFTNQNKVVPRFIYVKTFSFFLLFRGTFTFFRGFQHKFVLVNPENPRYSLFWDPAWEHYDGHVKVGARLRELPEVPSKCDGTDCQQVKSVQIVVRVLKLYRSDLVVVAGPPNGNRSVKVWLVQRGPDLGRAATERGYCRGHELKGETT